MPPMESELLPDPLLAKSAQGVPCVYGLGRPFPLVC